MNYDLSTVSRDPASASLPVQDATAIVAAFYRELVGRDADEQGLREYVRRLRAGTPGVTVPAIVHDITASEEAARVRIGAVLAEAAQVARAGRETAALPVVSLGTHCYTATLLKSAGLKTASYPFDWVFGSPGMVAHCLEDDFAAFLDPAYYEYVPPERRRDGPAVNLCDHRLFRDEYGVPFVFNHRNPLEAGDYAYLRRCVERFRELARHGRATFLLATHDALHWARGFERVSAALRAYAPASRLVYIVVTEHPGRVVPAVRVAAEHDGHALLELAAGSKWGSLWFANPLDDMAVLAEALQRS
jgi:hypothetical protein